MKSSYIFKSTIKAYLDKRTKADDLFAECYTKEEKNIDDCIAYILNSVNQSGCSGFADEEIYSMAIHYYDEDNIEISSPIKCNVVVNHSVGLSEAERELIRQEAIKEYSAGIIAGKTKPNKKTRKNVNIAQPSLFDL